MDVEGSAAEIARWLTQAIEITRADCSKCWIVETGPYYAQLLFNRDTIYGEVMSNAFLFGVDRLVADQELRLVDLGWTCPDEPCHSQCPRPHPNFHRQWSQDVPTSVVVHDVLMALMTVLGRAEGDRMVLKSTPRQGPVSTRQPANH